MSFTNPLASRAGHGPAGRPSNWTLLRLWIMRHRTRRAMAALDPPLLRDIGLTEETAQREAARPFWQA